MIRLIGFSANLQPLLRQVATLFGAVVVVTLAALIWFGMARPDADGIAQNAGPVFWIMLFTAMLLAAGLIGAARTHVRDFQRQQTLGDDLSDSRSRLQCLEEVLDVWQWETDRDHRLVSMRPPHGATSADWAVSTQHMPLWQYFRITDEKALRARLAYAAPLDEMAILRVDSADTSPRCGRLRGRARTDAAGLFAGYVGIVRELEATPALAPTAVTTAETTTAASAAAIALSMATPQATASSDHESFTYTVSHDLRAPIRVVEGFTKIIKEDYGRLLDRVGNDHLDRVLGAAARMSNMIDSLLALSKLSTQPLARQPVNLSQLAVYVADDLRRQWPDRNVTLVIEPGMLVQGDPTLLRVVVENLLANAWKYTCKCTQPQVWFERSAQQADSFSVRDNGAGFDMRFADRLFGVFQRLHSANDFPGTGVGLASVRRIVRRHEGDIWGEAEVNRGAQFHFSLPQPYAAR